MSQLHTVNNPALLTLCSKFLEAGDAVLLIEDGVYCYNAAALDKVPASTEIYALQSDLIARGLGPDTGSRVKKAHYDDFVHLCCAHSKVINWF